MYRYKSDIHNLQFLSIYLRLDKTLKKKHSIYDIAASLSILLNLPTSDQN